MKSRNLIAAAAAFAIGTAASAAKRGTLTGHWTGTMVSHGQPLAVAFDFDQSGRAPRGRFTAPTQAAMDYPLDRVARDADHIGFTLGGSILFDGTLSGDGLAGSFRSDAASGSFTLHRDAATSLPYATRDIAFRDGAVTLRGTLCLPRSRGRHPAVVLVHGSGPQTRWGTMRYIADRFARSGVAVLIYDKRGSGDSGGDWRSATYEDLARDALAAVAILAARPDVDPHRIGLVGHSQGGAIAPLVATLAPGRIAFLVAEDSFAGPQWQQDLYRVRNEVKSLALSQADEKIAMDVYSAFVDAARGARSYDAFEKEAAPYRDTAWYKWMAIPPRDSWVWGLAAKNENFDPLPLWHKVRAPVLLVYGEKDMLQPRDETIASIGGALDASGTPYSALIVPDAQHNLTIQPEPDGPFFWWHQAPGLVDIVIAWVLHEARDRPRG
ncbi:MAG TPA: alpha/beta fold hydrolase [Allosphingosinicella sp.]|jgi:hypothetical protein